MVILSHYYTGNKHYNYPIDISINRLHTGRMATLKNWQRKQRRATSIEDLKTINLEFKVIEQRGMSLLKWNNQLNGYTSGDSAQATQKSNAKIGRARYNKTLARARKSNKKAVVLGRLDWFVLLDQHSV